MTRSAFVRVYLIGVLFAIYSMSTAAEATVSQTHINNSNSFHMMSLSQAYQLALKNDAALAAARATYKSNAEVVPQARSQLMPQISGSANTTYNKISYPDGQSSSSYSRTQRYNSHGWSASITQSVFDLSQWFTLSASHAKNEVAKLTLAITEQQLIFDVASKYFAVLQAKDDYASAEAHLKAVKKQLDQTEERFKVGMVANTDVQEAKASYDSARVMVIQASNAITVAQENLSLLTNTPTPELYKLNQKMPVTNPEPMIVTTWERQAMANNLSVKQAVYNVNASRGDLHSAQSGHVPTIAGSLSYSHDVSDQPVFSDTSDLGRTTNGMTAALTLSVPIFSGGYTSSKAREAGYALESNQKNEDEARRTARINTRNQFNTINADVSQVNALCQSIISAESSLKATLSGYEVGTRTIIDVLNSQDSLYSAQKQYLDSRYSFILNTLQLKQTAGTLNPGDLNALNQWVEPSHKLPQSLTPYCQAEN